MRLQAKERTFDVSDKEIHPLANSITDELISERYIMCDKAIASCPGPCFHIV